MTCQCSKPQDEHKSGLCRSCGKPIEEKNDELANKAFFLGKCCDNCSRTVQNSDLTTRDFCELPSCPCHHPKEPSKQECCFNCITITDPLHIPPCNNPSCECHSKVSKRWEEELEDKWKSYEGHCKCGEDLDKFFIPFISHKIEEAEQRGRDEAITYLKARYELATSDLLNKPPTP